MRPVKTTRKVESNMAAQEAALLHSEAVSHLSAFVQGVAARAQLQSENLVKTGFCDRRVIFIKCEALGSQRWGEDHFLITEVAG